MSSASANCVDPLDTRYRRPFVLEDHLLLVRNLAGKAPGICGIPAELLKAGGYHTAQWLTKVFQAVWQSGQMPSDWKKGIILPLYKGKGSRRECKNYRGITLLSTPGKAFALTLLARVKTVIGSSAP